MRDVKMKGTEFEVELSTRLRNIPNVKVLANIELYSHSINDNTEIDRLIITPHRIYCAEAKSFNTELSGYFVDRDWYGYSGRYERKIFNPILQNIQHIRTLRNAFRRKGYAPPLIENVVVIPDYCRVNSDCDNIYEISAFVDKLIYDSCTIAEIDMSTVLTQLRKIFEVV